MDGARSSATLSVTPRTKVRRKPERASYDREIAEAILDEALFCAVGFVVDGEPYVVPMAFARSGDRLILHASSKSRFAEVLGSGARVCVTVTLCDGIVLARSAMHHSMNYRSVAVFGVPEELTEAPDKREALLALVEHVQAGRARVVREPNELELRATRVFSLRINEASVKRRSGGPIDDAEDLDLETWAGHVPLAVTAGAPVADTEHPPMVALPPELSAYARPRKRETP